MRNWCHWAAWGCLAIAPQLAAGAVVGKVSFSETHTRPISPSPISPSTAVTIRFGYSLAPGGFEDLTTSIFDTLLLDESDALQTFTLASNADEPEFEAFIARALNGFDDDLRVIAIGNEGGGGGIISPESGILQKSYFSGAPDLVESTVTALELYIASIVIDPTAISGQVNWSVSGELRFLGEAPITTPVPLLPAWALLAATLLAPPLRRRRQLPSTR